MRNVSLNPLAGPGSLMMHEDCWAKSLFVCFVFSFTYSSRPFVVPSWKSLYHLQRDTQPQEGFLPRDFWSSSSLISTCTVWGLPQHLPKSVTHCLSWMSKGWACYSHTSFTSGPSRSMNPKQLDVISDVECWKPFWLQPTLAIRTFSENSRIMNCFFSW